MTGYGYGSEQAAGARAAWQGLAESMERAHTDISGAGTAGLPPDVAAAGSAFLSRWSELTQQSREIANDFAAALEQSDTRYRIGDEQAQDRFHQLDGRLGGER